jgi:hypothetical protein
MLCMHPCMHGYILTQGASLVSVSHPVHIFPENFRLHAPPRPSAGIWLDPSITGAKFFFRIFSPALCSVRSPRSPHLCHHMHPAVVLPLYFLALAMVLMVYDPAARRDFLRIKQEKGPISSLVYLVCSGCSVAYQWYVSYSGNMVVACLVCIINNFV